MERLNEDDSVACGHFRSDASYLPELKSYLQQLLADRERFVAATDVQDWVRAKAAPSDEEIEQLRSCSAAPRVTSLTCECECRKASVAGAVRIVSSLSLPVGCSES